MPPAGSIDAQGPVLVFGGPYSNLEATRAVLSEAAAPRIPFDHIACTGDVVAYAADAAATVDPMRRSSANVVMGNWRRESGRKRRGRWLRVSGPKRVRARGGVLVFFGGRPIGCGRARMMALLPRRIDIRLGGYRLAVVHDGVTSINRIIFGSSPAAIKVQELTLAQVDRIIDRYCDLALHLRPGDAGHNPFCSPISR